MKLVFYKILINGRFGLSFLGAKWSEGSLIELAYAFEQRTLTRNNMKPYLLPNTQLADVVGT